MLGGPGEEVRACVCPPHPGPSSPVDLSAQCCCGVALCFNCRQDGGRTFPVGIAWRPQGSLKRQSRRASQAAPCPSPPLSRLPLPFASSLQVRAPLQAQASALLTHHGRQPWPTVAFEVRPCPGLCLHLALSGLRTHLLHDVAWCPPGLQTGYSSEPPGPTTWH